jgi:periplasmic protein TonB
VKTKRKNKHNKYNVENHTYEITDFNDLVFEYRNRDYGAYQLRKKYYSALLAGIIISSLLVTSLTVIPFLTRPKSERILTGGNRYIQVRMENLEPPAEDIYVPPEPPPPETAKITESVEYVAPVVVDTIIPVEQTQITAEEALASREGEVIDASRSGSGNYLLPGGNGTGNEEPLFIVEVMPTFKGGDLNRFRDWVQKRINYPQEAIDKKIKGTVILTFIIEKDGSVNNITIVKGVYPLLDNEAVRTISESPKWSPGLQRGKPVRVRFLIPLSFL